MFLLSWISVLKLEATIEVKLLSLIHWFNKYVLKAYFVLDIMLYTFTSYTRLNTYQFLFFRKSWAMPCQWSIFLLLSLLYSVCTSLRSPMSPCLWRFYLIWLHLSVPLDLWFSTKGHCAPRGHLATFGDIFGSYNWGSGVLLASSR